MNNKGLTLLSLGAGIALAMSSCSNDLPDVGSVYDGPMNTSYITVNLVTSGAQGSRAGDDADTPPTFTGADGTYQDGTGNENAVNNVRFYFFKQDGTAAKVKAVTGSEPVNYYDWTTPTASLTPDDNNIEKQLQAELVINTAEGDGLPYSIVAVCNLPDALKSVSVSSINGTENNETGSVSLNSLLGEYAVTSAGPFVLSNTVYYNSQRQLQEEAFIADHIYSSPGAATADPVTIYVERVNAKAQVTVTPGEKLVDASNELPSFNGRLVFDTQNEINNSIGNDLTDGEKIYVEFLGWNVTCATNNSYLMKHISDGSKWNNEGLFGNEELNWNSPTRHRSFWGINPALKYAPGENGNNYIYGNFNNAKAVESFETTGINYTYLQENAGLNADDPACAHPTQLIVAAQLLDADGEPLTLGEYGFNEYSLTGLQNKYASMCNVYVKSTGTNGGTVFNHIPGSWITFQTATQAGKASAPTATEDNGGRYYVYAALNMEAEGVKEAFNAKTIVIGDDDPDAEGATEDDINASLVSLGHAKLWNNGMTYYFVDIRHLGEYEPATETSEAVEYPGSFGIVRNHIYSLNIDALKGLGTPVYDDTETIYPEMPKEEDSYVGAQIEILNWRLVDQNVGFAW